MMKYIWALLVFACVACNDKTKNGTSVETNASNQLQQPSREVKVGGLYSLKNKDGFYYAAKVLALDEFAIHLRTYSNQFKNQPAALSSDTLKINLGHFPLAINGFLQEQPKLINVEDVKESELDGYRIYLKAMDGE